MIYLRLYLICCVLSGCATFYDDASVHPFSAQSRLVLPSTELPLKITYFADLHVDAAQTDAQIFKAVSAAFAKNAIQVIPYQGQANWLQIDVLDVRGDYPPWYLQSPAGLGLVLCWLTVCTTESSEIQLVFSLRSSDKPEQRLVLQTGMTQKMSLWVLPLAPFKTQARTMDNLYDSVMPFINIEPVVAP